MFSRRPRLEPTAYVHVRADGGVFCVMPDGVSSLISAHELERLVSSARVTRKPVMYTLDSGAEDSGPSVGLISMLLAGEAIRAPKQHPAALRPGIPTLIEAVLLGRPDLVGDLLSRGASPDSVDDRGHPALMYAVDGEQIGLVRQLLDAGADASAVDATGSTALMLAAQKGLKRIAIQLLDAGAVPGARGHHGLDAYDVALANGHATVAAIVRLRSEQD